MLLLLLLLLLPFLLLLHRAPNLTHRSPLVPLCSCLATPSKSP
jgi:hypothetical protein